MVRGGKKGPMRGTLRCVSLGRGSEERKKERQTSGLMGISGLARVPAFCSQQDPSAASNAAAFFSRRFFAGPDADMGAPSLYPVSLASHTNTAATLRLKRVFCPSLFPDSGHASLRAGRGSA